MDSAAHHHVKKSLGRMAVFLIPSAKLQMQDLAGETVEKNIRSFLMQHYSGYTTPKDDTFGCWKDASGVEHCEECREYKVSFAGKERIDHLSDYLAYLALFMDESCIYFETGEDSWLIYPTEEFRQQYQNFR